MKLKIILASLLATALAIVLVACGGGESEAGSSSRISASDIGQGLSAGEYEINITGAVNSTGPYRGDQPAARFLPSVYSAARERDDGYGGRERVATSNADGPYAVRLRWAMSRNDSEEEMGMVWIQLPPDARAGKSYPIRNIRRARPGEAYAELHGEYQAWRERGWDLEGSVSIAELGEHLTLAFEFHNGQDDQRRVEVDGRVFQLPRERRAEARYTFTSEGETDEFLTGMGRQAQDQRFVVMLGAGQIYFTFDSARPEPGTYSMARGRAPGVVDLNMPDYRYNSVDGTLELVENDGEYSATFRFSTEGDKPVNAQGAFEHVAVP